MKVSVPAGKLLCLALSVLFCNVSGYQLIFNARAEDKVIQSEHYPSTYPRDLNITWKWDVQSGFWAVVFKDFDLDSGRESIEKYDWLEVYDGCCKRLRYKSDNGPLVAYRTYGPHLTIQFVTDGKTEHNSRGFSLHVLHGDSERELELKIHDVENEERKEKEDEESSPLLVIIAAALIFLIVIIVVVVIILWQWHKRRHGRYSGRNKYGVRRDSGISHSRRRTPPHGGPAPNSQGQPQPQQPGRQQEQQQQQQQQQQHRLGRPVQRSNSTLNWIARAELTTTIQTAGRPTQANIYTPSAVTTETDPKTSPEALNNGDASRDATHTEDRTSNARGNTSENHVRNASRSLNNVIPATSQTETAGGSSRNVSDDYLTPVTLATMAASAAGSFENSREDNLVRSSDGSIGDYIETVDSLNPGVAVSDSLSVTGCDDNRPPSYNESYLSPFPPPYHDEEGKSAKKDNCYENVAMGSRGGCVMKGCGGSQTNIYINTAPMMTGCVSSRSLNRITIGTSNTATAQYHHSASQENATGDSTKNPDGWRPENLRALSDPSESRDGQKTRSPSCRKHNPTTPTSASSVHHVDGYAYIVPVSSSGDTKQLCISPTDANANWSMANTTSIKMDFVSNNEGENASDDTAMPKRCGQISNQIYVNV